jgi:hypothetical protein
MTPRQRAEQLRNHYRARAITLNDPTFFYEDKEAMIASASKAAAMWDAAIVSGQFG